MLDIIPLQDLGLEKRWPRLDKLQDELVGLEQHRQRAEEQASLLQNGLASARERDLSAAAEAVRGGGDLPGNTHEEAIVAELERSRRDAVIYQRAVSAVMSDIGQLRSKHQAELFADVVGERQKIAKQIADAARVASSGFARFSDLERLVRTLEPLEPVEESDEPPQNVTRILSFAASNQRAPERGDVEATLSYLASLGEAADLALDEQGDDLVGLDDLVPEAGEGAA